MAKTLIAAGSLASHKAVDNAAIALGDLLRGDFAVSVRGYAADVSFELTAHQRMELAHLLEHITDAIRVTATA